MKEYIICRTKEGVTCHVEEQSKYIRKPGDAPRQSSYPLPHCVLHSPDGFEIGYGGSGPADLALSILADHLGTQKEIVECCARGNFSLPAEDAQLPALRALRLHQFFKEDFLWKKVASDACITITGEAIQGWLDDDAAFEASESEKCL